MHRFLWLQASLLLLWPAATSHAIILFVKGESEPIVGQLVRQEGPAYRVLVETPEGRTFEREFMEAELDSVLITVSNERLTALSPHNPEAYRDYAEELAEKRKDPDARLAAVRLYLIAAYLAPESLGRSCLLGMAPLARTPLQERQFQAMAFLLDPHHDPKLLPAKNSEGEKVDQQVLDGERILLKALREFRRGNTRLARTLLDQDRVKRAIASYEDIMTYDELYNAEYDTPPETLYKLLKLELRLVRGPDPTGEPKLSEGASWSEIAKRGMGEPAPTLSLETITAFDPRQCVYRNGKWVTPEVSDP